MNGNPAGGFTGTDPVKESQTRHLLKHLWAVTSVAHLYSIRTDKPKPTAHLHDCAQRRQHKQSWSRLHKHARAKYCSSMNRCTFSMKKVLQRPLRALLLWRKRPVLPLELYLCRRLASGVFKCCRRLRHTALHIDFFLNLWKREDDFCVHSGWIVCTEYRWEGVSSVEWTRCGPSSSLLTDKMWTLRAATQQHRGMFYKKVMLCFCCVF